MPKAARTPSSPRAAGSAVGPFAEMDRGGGYGAPGGPAAGAPGLGHVRPPGTRRLPLYRDRGSARGTGRRRPPRCLHGRRKGTACRRVLFRQIRFSLPPYGTASAGPPFSRLAAASLRGGAFGFRGSRFKRTHFTVAGRLLPPPCSGLPAALTVRRPAARPFALFAGVFPGGSWAGREKARGQLPLSQNYARMTCVRGRGRRLPAACCWKACGPKTGI